MLNRPCLTCQTSLAIPGQSRCAPCFATSDKRRTAHRRAAVSNNAASRMRRAVNKAGSAQCAYCRVLFPASYIQVDHHTALADGGTDLDHNVLPACKDCHTAKTTAENKARKANNT